MSAQTIESTRQLPCVECEEVIRKSPALRALAESGQLERSICGQALLNDRLAGELRVCTCGRESAPAERKVKRMGRLEETMEGLARLGCVLGIYPSGQAVRVTVDLDDVSLADVVGNSLAQAVKAAAETTGRQLRRRRVRALPI